MATQPSIGAIRNITRKYEFTYRTFHQVPHDHPTLIRAEQINLPVDNNQCPLNHFDVQLHRSQGERSIDLPSDFRPFGFGKYETYRENFNRNFTEFISRLDKYNLALMSTCDDLFALKEQSSRRSTDEIKTEGAGTGGIKGRHIPKKGIRCHGMLGKMSACAFAAGGRFFFHALPQIADERLTPDQVYSFEPGFDRESKLRIKNGWGGLFFFLTKTPLLATRPSNNVPLEAKFQAAAANASERFTPLNQVYSFEPGFNGESKSKKMTCPNPQKKKKNIPQHRPLHWSIGHS